MSITYQELLQALKLDPDKDPFGKWNAADERDLLPTCFVAPPYFESVLGNPKAAASSIVFAPTGAGKTAQSVMIQQRASDSTKNASLIALVYDDFERQGVQSLKDATLANHLRALNRVGTGTRPGIGVLRE